jgi:hypothetical protein
MPAINPPKRTRRSIAAVRSRKQEEEGASKYGGHRVVGSGSGIEKGDGRTRGVARIEFKTTQKKSFSITLEMIQKIENAALGGGELPIIEVEFLDAKGLPEATVALMPSWALQTLVSQCSTVDKSPKL